MNVPLLRIESYQQVLLLKLGVGYNIASDASPTAEDPVRSNSAFSVLSISFFPILFDDNVIDKE